jgi:putative ubiquitin-RnfH superfamily antitoxin RatB of RatAB toxin-antitoxin module
MSESPTIRVQVAWADGNEQALVDLDLAAGVTALDAVTHAALDLDRRLQAGELACAIYGRRVDARTPLADGDRVEVTRPLVEDAMSARRRRAARTG